jgi:hypothetical protein
LEGRLVADWAEQAQHLITKDVLPKGLIVDLTEVSYVDPVGEQMLKWLASTGAMFAPGSVYGFAICDRLRLPPARSIAGRRKRHRNKAERPTVSHSPSIEAI